jgi:predicted acylesterase/phospholipase RssA
MTTTPASSTDSNTPITEVQAALSEEEAASKQARAARGEDAANINAPVGLALSGGGIRSATFCLGVIQAFAQCDKLKKINYLSTVSGGGYVGSWLSAWIHRKGFDFVSNALKSVSPRSDGYVEAPEVTWLRRYSNYLAPKIGMLSADSMTLVATWLRNVLLNIFILIAFLAICFLIPRLLVEPARFAMTSLGRELGYASAWFAFFLFPTGISFQLSKAMSQDRDGHIELMNTTWGVLILVIVPGILTALLGSIPLFAPEVKHPDLPRLAIIAFALLTGSGLFWFAYMLIERRPFVDILGEAFVFLMAYGLAVVVGIGILSGFERLFMDLAKHSRLDQAVATEIDVAALLSFGPPALLVTFGVVGWVIVGLVGRTYLERTREWWARMNAWFIILGLVWVALFSLAFYSAPILTWAHERSRAWFSAIAGTGWLTSLVSTLVAKRAPEGERSVGASLKEMALNVALLIVVAGILVGVAGGVGLVFEGLAKGTGVAGVTAQEGNAASVKAQPPIVLKVEPRAGESATITLASTPALSDSYRSRLEASFMRQTAASATCLRIGTSSIGLESRDECGEGFHIPLMFLMVIACALVLLTFGWRVDVNKFSLHNMYKNRLIRCYLGASRYDVRKAHPFTGFDEADDLPLSDLRKPAAPDMVAGPVHILNAALNITHGRNLAWQERKAAAFTFTPWYCGFELGPSTGDADAGPLLSAGRVRTGGYRPSEDWASQRDEQRKFSLGTAMATSGAAVSSISGKSSKPMLGFIMTVFNARLGRWSPNPLWRNGWKRSGPSWGLAFLLKELFGYATEVSNYVYLSDGGHFDNTGVYELVRRRCKTIIVVDATADVERAMGDLADMVRKCRVDFGVNIDFDLSKLGTSRILQSTSKGFVVGRIFYPDKPLARSRDGNLPDDAKAFKGKLVVIKPTLIELATLGVMSLATRELAKASRNRRPLTSSSRKASSRVIASLESS